MNQVQKIQLSPMQKAENRNGLRIKNNETIRSRKNSRLPLSFIEHDPSPEQEGYDPEEVLLRELYNC